MSRHSFYQRIAISQDKNAYARLSVTTRAERARRCHASREITSVAVAQSGGARALFRAFSPFTPELLFDLAAPLTRVVPHALSQLWVYVTLGATGIVTEEIAPVTGGFAAEQGHLELLSVMVSVAIGTWLADIGLYWIGRVHGHRVAARWPKLQGPMARLLGAVQTRPWRASGAVRFAYGARLLLPITCGAARLPPMLYIVGSGISAWSWTILFTLLGWGFGETAERVLGHVRRYERYIALFLICAVALSVWILQRRNRGKVAGEIEGVRSKGEG